MQVSTGVNTAMQDWGDSVLARFGTKSREAAWDKDFALQYVTFGDTPRQKTTT
jgi:hypothetical protein